MHRNCMNLMTGRIAISYMQNAFENEGLGNDDYEYLDYLIGELRCQKSELTNTDYTDDDLFRLSGFDIQERYNGIHAYEDEILKAYPDDNMGLYTDFLETALYRNMNMSMYDGIGQDILRKCMYMKNNSPSSTVDMKPGLILSADDLKALPENTLKDVMDAVQAYDTVYGIYGIGYDGNCNGYRNVYIMDATDKVFLPIYCNDREYKTEEEIGCLDKGR